MYINGEETFKWKQGARKWCYVCKECGKSTSTTIWSRAKVAYCRSCKPNLVGLL